jgi:hypothetical protein
MASWLVDIGAGVVCPSAWLPLVSNLSAPGFACLAYPVQQIDSYIMLTRYAIRYNGFETNKKIKNATLQAARGSKRLHVAHVPCHVGD